MAALATIELLEEGLMENAVVQGNRLMEGLVTLQQSHECIGDVRGKGLMVAVEFVKDRETKEPARTGRNNIIRQAFQKGLLLLGCGENSIRFCPSLTVNTAEIDTCLSIFDDVLRKTAV
jgi:4-aminobutyrate aminotransferase